MLIGAIWQANLTFFWVFVNTGRGQGSGIRGRRCLLVKGCAIPGLRNEISTPRTKACSWGPRTWGTRMDGARGSS